MRLRPSKHKFDSHMIESANIKITRGVRKSEQRHLSKHVFLHVNYINNLLTCILGRPAIMVLEDREWTQKSSSHSIDSQAGSLYCPRLACQLLQTSSRVQLGR